MTERHDRALLQLFNRLAEHKSATKRKPSVISRNEVEVPRLLTVVETATVLRTTNKAIYAMAERGLLPGVTRIGRRVLFRADELASWLDQKRVPSLEE